MGQRQIVAACPYRVIYWNEEKDIPQKCTLWVCSHHCSNSSLRVVREREGGRKGKNWIFRILKKCSIFLSHHEVIMLVDVPVYKTAKELGVTSTSVYTKYTGLSPP